MVIFEVWIPAVRDRATEAHLLPELAPHTDWRRAGWFLAITVCHFLILAPLRFRHSRSSDISEAWQDTAGYGGRTPLHGAAARHGS